MPKVRAIDGKGDWTDVPPTGMNDGDVINIINDFVVNAGVVLPEAGNALVTQSDTPGMHVKVAAGIIYVENSAWTQNSYEPRFWQVVRNAATTAVAISSNSSGQLRYDAICQEVDTVTTPNDNADNICPITVVEGTPGETTVTIPDDHELLAIVAVADGETSITNSEIVDYRTPVFGRHGFINPGFVELDDDTTITFDAEYGVYNRFFVAIEGNRTLTFDNFPVGQFITIYIQQADGGGQVPTFSDSIVTNNGVGITFSGADGAIDVLGVLLLPSGDYHVSLLDSNLS
jgi:hypothetical protein